MSFCSELNDDCLRCILDMTPDDFAFRSIAIVCKMFHEHTLGKYKDHMRHCINKHRYSVRWNNSFIARTVAVSGELGRFSVSEMCKNPRITVDYAGDWDWETLMKTLGPRFRKDAYFLQTYPRTFCRYVVSDLSQIDGMERYVVKEELTLNRNLSVDIIVKFGKWSHISQRTDLSSAFIKEHWDQLDQYVIARAYNILNILPPDKYVGRADLFGALSMNPATSLKDVKCHIDERWNWSKLTDILLPRCQLSDVANMTQWTVSPIEMTALLTDDIPTICAFAIDNNPMLMQHLSRNRHVTVDIIATYSEASWNWSILSRRISFTSICNSAREDAGLPWDWQVIAQRDDIDWRLITDNLIVVRYLAKYLF